MSWGKPFKKGVSVNPGGLPGRMRGKKMVEWIAHATRDGLLMAEYFVSVMNDKKAAPKDKREAAMWLADRFAGKAVDVTMTGELAQDENPLRELDIAELKALVRVTENAQKPPQNSEGGSLARIEPAKSAEPKADSGDGE